ncbi:MAG TPA: BatD family protein [Steroidobacteraceae bacterium]|jgi:hypothetical protein
MAFGSIAEASAPSVTQSIEPSTIDLGGAARLVISESGTDTPAITPPMVAGLEFVALSQAQRMESVNGVTNSTSSVTYQVIPREVGVYTIPGAIPGSASVVLTVNPAASAGHGQTPGSASGPGPQVGPGMRRADPIRMNSDGSAFVRLRLAKHELYVGETVPVDIEVGMRDGLVASLNGLPTLNGDEFTLSKLSSDPQRTEEMIDGKSFTVLTWRSALAAVKPGALSLMIETPLTVRMRDRTRPGAGLLGEAGLDDFFNDPVFQNFFSASTEKDVTVASKPADFTVLALPTRDRPANFSGAVGHFSISSDLSDRTAAAGDPVTLRMHVSGTGNFDRVTAPMLNDVDHWKTYATTSTFNAQDGIGYRGEKTFEEPVIPMKPGELSLPPLTFSWFDPSTRRYVQARTSPPPITVTAASTEKTVAGESAPPSKPSASIPNNAGGGGLRADYVVNGGGTAWLTPHYYQLQYIAAPSALVLAFSGAWLWFRRRERVSAHAPGGDGRSSLDPEPLLSVLDEAIATGDPELFFKSARAALQRCLASRWHLLPSAITREELDERLGPQSDAARVFMLADETAYAGVQLTAHEFQHWKTLVLGCINGKGKS